MRIRRTLGAIGLFFLAACGANEVIESESSRDEALSLDAFFHLATRTVDRSTPDPSNPWAQKSLGLGEENVLPNERATFADLTNRVEKLMNAVKRERGADAVVRGFHPKSHACLEGNIEIDVSRIPPDARVGVFSENTTKKVWVRLSNGAGTFQKDKKVDVRGLAIKILGVEGPRLSVTEADADAHTQDFLFTNGSINIAADPLHFVQLGEAFQGARDEDTLLGRFGNMADRGAFLTKTENVRMLDYIAHHVLDRSLKVGSYLGESFWTAAPLAMGIEDGDPNAARAKRAAKLMVVGGTLQGERCVPAGALESIPRTLDENYFRTDFKKHLLRESACFDLFVQYQSDARREPIEDVSVEWKTPFVKVGRIVIPRGDIDRNPAKESFCNELTFTPWHTLVDHRPLGSMMRARRVIYPRSMVLRNGAAEPTGTETF